MDLVNTQERDTEKFDSRTTKICRNMDDLKYTMKPSYNAETVSGMVVNYTAKCLVNLIT
jgi:hypothetical protein